MLEWLWLQAQKGGLVHAVGSGSAIVTSGRFGSIMLWPEAELRSVAEAAGFVLPPPRSTGPATSDAPHQLSISQASTYAPTSNQQYERCTSSRRPF